MSAWHEEEAASRSYDHRLMRRLMGYLRPYRAQVWLAGAVVLLDALAQLAAPLLTREAIDRGIRRHDLVRLDQVAVLYLLVLLASFGLGYVQNQVMQRVGQHVMMDLRLAIFRKLQRLPLAFFDRNPVGRLMTRVTNDVDVLNELVTSGVLALFADLFALVGILIAMWRLNAELLGVAFSVVPLIFVVTLTFRIKVRRSFRDVRTRLARLNAFLNENLTGMATVQLLNRAGAQPRRVPRHQRRAPRRQPAGELLPRDLLPGARTGERAGGLAHRLVRRPAGHVDRASRWARWWRSSSTRSASSGPSRT